MLQRSSRSLDSMDEGERRSNRRKWRERNTRFLGFGVRFGVHSSSISFSRVWEDLGFLDFSDMIAERERGDCAGNLCGLKAEICLTHCFESLNGGAHLF